MDNLAYKFNRNLIILVATLPFLSFLIWHGLGITSVRVIQILSYLGIILLFIFSNRTKRIIIPKYLIFYLLFILYVFYSTFIQLNRDFKINYLFSQPYITGFSLMLIIENLPISKKFYDFIFKLSKYILAIAIGVIFYQQIIDDMFFINPDVINNNLFDEGSSRLHSIYSWAGSLTNGFGFVPIFILVVEDLYKKQKKIIFWILFGIIYVILTKARWIMLNAFLVFIILIINNKNKTKQLLKYIFLVPIFLVMSYFTLNAIGINAKRIVEDRILETNKTNDHKSATTRLLAIKVFNKLYWKNAVFGVGPIKYGMGGTGQQDYLLRRELGQRSSQIHVGYLSLFYVYGLIGGGLFLTFLYLLLSKLYKNAKRTRIWAPFLAFLGVAIANLTLVNFNMFEMGLIIVLVANKFYLQSTIVNTPAYV